MSEKRIRFWLLSVTLVVLAVVLGGCSSAGGVGRTAALTGASWPGIAEAEDTLYVAYGPQVYAVDPETGRDIWSYPAEPERNRTFYAPPAVGDDMIVVGDYSNSLTALNPDNGSELWTFNADRRFVGGAAIGDEMVYAGTVDGELHAVDRTTGDEVWAFDVDRDIWSTPLLDGNTVYVTALDRHVYALDASSGDLLWQFPADGETTDPAMGAMAGTPTLVDGTLIFGSFNNHVYALDVDSQQIKWTYPTTNWVWSSPTYDEASGLLIGGDLDGRVFALDAETGEEVWTFETGGPVVGAPVITEGEDGETLVYFTSEDANLYVLNAETGTQAETPVGLEAEFTTRFLFFPGGTNIRPIPIYAPPILIDDLIILGAHQGDNLLYALDRETLLDRWQFNAVSS